MKRPNTVANARMLAMYVHDGMSQVDIAAALGVSRQAVSKNLRKITTPYEKRARGQYVSREAAAHALRDLQALHDRGDSTAIQHQIAAHMRGASRDVLAVS